MSVNAVQNNNSSNKMSYIGSMTVGAFCGYASKWALPITAPEKDEIYKAGLARVKNEARLAKINELKLIGKDFLKSTGVDEFIHLFEDEKLTDSALKEPKRALPEDVSELFKRIRSIGNQAEELGIKKLNLITKGIRPTGTFALIGASIALGIALTNNICTKTPLKHEGIN